MPINDVSTPNDQRETTAWTIVANTFFDLNGPALSATCYYSYEWTR